MRIYIKDHADRRAFVATVSRPRRPYTTCRILTALRDAEAIVIADASIGEIGGPVEALQQLARYAYECLRINAEALSSRMLEWGMSYALQHHQFSQAFPYTVGHMAMAWFEECARI